MQKLKTTTTITVRSAVKTTPTGAQAKTTTTVRSALKTRTTGAEAVKTTTTIVRSASKTIITTGAAAVKATATATIDSDLRHPDLKQNVFQNRDGVF